MKKENPLRRRPGKVVVPVRTPNDGPDIEKLRDLVRAPARTMSIHLVIDGEISGSFGIDAKLQKQIAVSAYVNSRTLIQLIKYALEYSTAPVWELENMRWKVVDTDGSIERRLYSV